MGVSVVSADLHAVILRAPLAPNINHRQTAFGGSVSALAMLASWSLLHGRLQGEGITAQLVIHRNTMEFERPITGAFTARAEFAQTDSWAPFMRMLQRRGKARISVKAELSQDGKMVGKFSGDFVALQTSTTGAP